MTIKSIDRLVRIGNWATRYLKLQVVHGRKRHLALPSETDALDSSRVTADHYNFHRSVAVAGDRQGSLSSYVFGPDKKAGREDRGEFSA